MVKGRMCLHLTEIEDRKSGFILCSSCGLVLCTNLFQHDSMNRQSFTDYSFHSKYSFIDECCHRMHVPDGLISSIIHQFKTYTYTYLMHVYMCSKVLSPSVHIQNQWY